MLLVLLTVIANVRDALLIFGHNVFATRMERLFPVLVLVVVVTVAVKASI